MPVRHVTLGEAEEGLRGAVWRVLEARCPEVRARALDIWIARREGRVRRLVATDERFRTLRVPWGPLAEADWELLAGAALEATDPVE